MAKLTKRVLKNPLSITRAFEKGATIHDVNTALTELMFENKISSKDEFRDMLMSVEVAYADYYELRRRLFCIFFFYFFNIISL